MNTFAIEQIVGVWASGATLCVEYVQESIWNMGLLVVIACCLHPLCQFHFACYIGLPSLLSTSPDWPPM